MSICIIISINTLWAHCIFIIIIIIIIMVYFLVALDFCIWSVFVS